MPCKSSRRFWLANFAATSVQLLLPLTVYAGSYEAICAGRNKCTITIADDKLTTPGATIEKENILSWSEDGEGSKNDNATKAASFLGFGLVGLFAARGVKTHDYKYKISHVDEDGNSILTTIAFKNNKPAKRFSKDLIEMTGLTAGETNQELKARLEVLKEEAAERERIANLECGIVLKQYGCSWSAYLEANPPVKAWAEAFPEMAEKERMKQGAIE